MKRYLRRTTLFLLSDLLGLLTAFGLGFTLANFISQTLRHTPYLELISPEVQQSAFTFMLFMVGSLLAFYSKGHYTQRLPWWHQVRQITLLLLSTMLIQGFCHYILKYPLSRMWVASTWGLAIPLLLIGRLVARSALIRMKKWSIPTTLIGGHGNIMETAYALHSDFFADYAVQHIVILNDSPLTVSDLPRRYQKARITHGLPEALTAAAKHRQYVVLAPDDTTMADTNTVMEALQDRGTDYAFIPPTFDQNLYELTPRYFFGHNVVMFHPNQANRRTLETLGKRLLDICGAGLGLIVLAPVFGYIAWKIHKEEPTSNIFFGHKRVGHNGKAFPCYKFTSMVPNASEVLTHILATDPAAKAEWERDFKLKNDPRITRIGAKLRSTSLDELPQLWNVLKGDMSLVGPRPIVQDETKYYGKSLKSYLACKPGVTGLWQVSGRNDTSYAYRVYLDTWYAKHWSIWHDIVILFETVKIVLTRSGAY